LHLRYNRAKRLLDNLLHIPKLSTIMGLWSYIRRKVLQTPQEGPQVAPPGTTAGILDRLDHLESEHRKDRLELLDLHERAKTTLAKMARRARDVEPEAVAATPQPDDVPTAPRVTLLSRRSRG